MKYEFRWLQEKVEYGVDGDIYVKVLYPGTIIPVDNLSKVVTQQPPPKLQYRYLTWIGSTANWSKWRDIPTIEDPDHEK